MMYDVICNYAGHKDHVTIHVTRTCCCIFCIIEQLVLTGFHCRVHIDKSAIIAL